jgi:hypothetical protein
MAFGFAMCSAKKKTGLKIKISEGGHYLLLPGANGRKSGDLLRNDNLNKIPSDMRSEPISTFSMS